VYKIKKNMIGDFIIYLLKIMGVIIYTALYILGTMYIMNYVNIPMLESNNILLPFLSIFLVLIYVYLYFYSLIKIL
jgi:hypothetical protein